MKPSFSIDAVDRKILRILQVDASMIHADLADLVGASPASCWRRVKALEAAGVLGVPVRLLTAEAPDRTVNVICNVRMRSHAADVCSRFEEFVLHRPEVMECLSMSGEWDYLLRVVARDVGDYDAFLRRHLLRHESVGAASSQFALSLTKYTTAFPI